METPSRNFPTIFWHVLAVSTRLRERLRQSQAVSLEIIQNLLESEKTFFPLTREPENHVYEGFVRIRATINVCTLQEFREFHRNQKIKYIVRLVSSIDRLEKREMESRAAYSTRDTRHRSHANNATMTITRE